jgi:tetratricopeptide (TPR) repeat protein
MMRRVWLIALIFAVIEPAGFASAARLLQGQVLESHGGTTKPAANAHVWIVNVGNPYTTGPDGGYRVLVPDAIQIHQEITLFVKRRGWFVATPVGGKLELPVSLKADLLLSPESSVEFLAPAQLAKLLESLPEKMKSQVKVDGKAGDTDPKQVVRDYAEEHHLSENEAVAKVDALVLQYEQSPEPEKRCLAAIYRKHVDQAATTCRTAATSKTDLLKQKRQEVENLSKVRQSGGREEENQSGFTGLLELSVRLVTSRPTRAQFMAESRSPAKLEEAKRQLIKLTEEVVGEFQSTGDIYYANYQFDEALKAYDEGLSYVEKKDLPTTWADMQWSIGMANWQIGIRTRDAAITEHLREAVKRYGEAQTVYTKTDFPEAWSAIENNLGNVLRDQGTRTGGEAGTQLLAQAVAAYRDALTVYTQEQLPQDWAMTQNNLGNVLGEQGTRTGGEAGTQLLAQAVAAYKAALEIRTREHLPEGWAQTHNNLARVYVALEDWQGAATSYRNVLTLYPDVEEAYLSTHMAYHEKLFSYASAFDLTKQWLDRHPTDLAAQANFAEAHLTTGRYGEAERRLGELLTKPDLDSSSAVGLRIVEIVNALALRKAGIVPDKLRGLRRFVTEQPESFSGSWSFEGTRQYTHTEKVFTPYAAWLSDLFSVVESKDRASFLAALDHVKTGFAGVKPP